MSFVRHLALGNVELHISPDLLIMIQMRCIGRRKVESKLALSALDEFAVSGNCQAWLFICAECEAVSAAS